MRSKAVQALGFTLSVILALLPIQSWTYKVAILNIDSKVYCCTSNDPNRTRLSSSYAPLGRMKCDSPQLLVEKMFTKLNETEGQIDALLITGDIVGHSLAIELTDQPNPYYNKLIYQVIGQIANYTDQLFTQIIDTYIFIQTAQYLPSSVILPTLGNNDYTYKYQSPFGSDEQQYYSFFYEQFFAKHPVNKNLTELANIKNTILNGGYY